MVFDLDGTLVDTRADIVAATRFALGIHGGPDRTDDEIAGFVGDGARQLVARAFGLPDDSGDVLPLLETFLSHYEANPATRARPMPGAVEVLSRLTPLPLAVCTNKSRRVTGPLLRALDLTRHFSLIVAGDDLAERKPHPAPLHHIAAHLGVPSASLAMIGDGVQDLRAGRAAGAFTVGVLGGFGSREVLLAEEPDALVENLLAVAPLLGRA